MHNKICLLHIQTFFTNLFDYENFTKVNCPPHGLPRDTVCYSKLINVDVGNMYKIKHNNLTKMKNTLICNITNLIIVY